MGGCWKSIAFCITVNRPVWLFARKKMKKRLPRGCLFFIFADTEPDLAINGYAEAIDFLSYL